MILKTEFLTRSIKNKKDLDIQKYFVVSTAHITKEENDDLINAPHTDSPLCVHSNEYHHVIAIPQEDLDDFEDSVSGNILNLLKIAKKNGCDYLKLDCDGFVYDDLPKFDW